MSRASGSSSLSRARVLAALAFSLSAACVDTSVEARDAGPDTAPAPPAVSSVEAVDREGASWPLDALPREPRFVVHTTTPVSSDEPFVFLLAGRFDSEEWEALLDDLQRPPLLVRHRQKLLDWAQTPESSDSSDGGTSNAEGAVWAAPQLELGGHYVVAIGAWALDANEQSLSVPHAEPITVARQRAGASVVASWPPDGVFGVPYRMPLLALRFDDEVRAVAADAIALRGPGGPERVVVEHLPCDFVGWVDPPRGPQSHCRAVRPAGDLAPNASYRLLVTDSLVDRAGASVGPWEARFSTGAEPSRAIELLPVACHLDEQPIGPGCALADDRSITFRAKVDGPVRAFATAASVEHRQVAGRGEVMLRMAPLRSDASVEISLRLIGLDGTSFHEVLAMRTPPPLATLTISEVRANPNGPEPRQEMVEVLNFGSEPVSLQGVALSDRNDRMGDILDTSQQLPPGGRALLVADTFDPNDDQDTPVPPGVMLVRVGTSLASGGLSNAGEPLYLRDAAVHRLSAVPALPTAGGECLVRRAVSDRAAYGFTVEPCTPGTAPP